MITHGPGCRWNNVPRSCKDRTLPPDRPSPPRSVTQRELPTRRKALSPLSDSFNHSWGGQVNAGGTPRNGLNWRLIRRWRLRRAHTSRGLRRRRAGRDWRRWWRVPAWPGRRGWWVVGRWPLRLCRRPRGNWLGCRGIRHGCLLRVLSCKWPCSCAPRAATQAVQSPSNHCCSCRPDGSVYQPGGTSQRTSLHQPASHAAARTPRPAPPATSRANVMMTVDKQHPSVDQPQHRLVETRPRSLRRSPRPHCHEPLQLVLGPRKVSVAVTRRMSRTCSFSVFGRDPYRAGQPGSMIPNCSDTNLPTDTGTSPGDGRNSPNVRTVPNCVAYPQAAPVPRPTSHHRQVCLTQTEELLQFPRRKPHLRPAHAGQPARPTETRPASRHATPLTSSSEKLQTAVSLDPRDGLFQ